MESKRVKPHICVVSAVAGTITTFLSEQIKAFTAVGWEVAVICSPEKSPSVLEKLPTKVLPVSIPRRIAPIDLIRAIAGLTKICAHEKFDIVHTHTPLASFVGQMAAILAGVPIRIVTVHGFFFANVNNPWLRLLLRALEVITCRLATKVITVSAEDAQFLIDKSQMAPSKITVMHVGVNLSTFELTESRHELRNEVRNAWNIPHDAFVFGIVARMVREKGFMELFEAFANLKRRHGNVFLMVVGPEDNSRNDGIKLSDAHRSGCGDKILFTGAQRDIPRFMAAMDAFCLPSHREGFPVSLMEASAMGLACITTDIRGCREAVLAGETGIVIPPRDSAALERAMEYLIDYPQERRRMGLAAYARARTHFDRQDVVEKTLSLYQSELNMCQ